MNCGKAGLCGLLMVFLSVSTLWAGGVEEGDGRLSFLVGEVLRYRIYWGFIPVGESVASTEWAEEDGRRLLRIRFRTRSFAVLDRIYPVDDNLETLIDPDTFLPVRFVKQLSEGSYRADQETVFDHEAGTAHWHCRLNDQHDTYDIEPSTRDLLTFIYLLRGESFEVGTEQEYRVMADEKIYDLVLQIQDTERIRDRSGRRHRTVRIEPQAAFEGVFVRRGRMRLWVSRDEYPALIQMKVRVPVANVSLVLEEVESAGTPVELQPVRGQVDDADAENGGREEEDDAE